MQIKFSQSQIYLLSFSLLLGSERLFAGIEPEARLGGQTSVNQQDRNAFSRPAANLSPMRQLDFKVGNSFFKAPWVLAPSSTTARDGLGPLFNTNACQNCHVKDGRGLVPAANTQRAANTEQAISLFLRLSRPATTPEEIKKQAQFGPLDDPIYGGQLQNFATTQIKPEAEMQLRYQTQSVLYADGHQVDLRVPHYALIHLAYGQPVAGLETSPRIAPAMIGLGLLEQLPEQAIMANADPDDLNQDGISGKANRVWDIQQQRSTLGRFGWKAGQPNLKQQNSGAFAGDMGLTTRLHPKTDCTSAQPCHLSQSGGEPEVSDRILNLVTFYTQHLAVPAQRQPKAPEVQAGYQLFNQLQCQACHIEHWQTELSVDSPELSQQQIRPFTDLLLHDMGAELADHRPEFLADGQEWRTPPLWGIGLNKVVTGQENYLHDGRARTLEEAILWHGGEAKTSQAQFKALPFTQRQQLIQFLESL